VEGLKGEIQMILDWIEADPGEMDTEKRLVINLKVRFKLLKESINFIYRDWKV
jgi:hypothetical protein